MNPEQARAAAAAVAELPRDELEPGSPYLVSGGRICRRRQTKDGPVIEPLCNFVASVTEEIVLDDGADTTRAFLLEGQLDAGPHLPAIRVPAARFPGMAWVTENWGLRAVVRAGMATRDALREAIQTLSPTAGARHIFTHTGWRLVGGQWIYLTAAGAIGAPGDAMHLGYEVDLGPDLDRYRLPLQVENPVGAMQESLRLLRGDLAPMTVMAPLWGAIYRAPTATACPIDVSLWIEGATGSLKSTLAALALAHFGAFDRVHLPGAWTSTANQLERRAFLLKDVPFIIDDYAPGSPDVRELEIKAARLLRAAGNGAGRGRLRADLTERPAYPPRGIIVVTGEQHPPGQSLLARTLVTELDGSAVNLAAVSQAQAGAARLPHAMAGFVAWLAPQMQTLPRVLGESFAALRARAGAGEGHLRVPEAIAHLYLGLDMGLSYATEIAACSPKEATDLRDQAWTALVALSATQAALILGEQPSHRFLKVLLTLLVQGKGALLDRTLGGDVGRADLLGWQDPESLLLLPEATYHAVARFCRDEGTGFSIREERLRRDLEKEGLLDADPDRRTTTVRIDGRSRRVLRLHRALAEDIAGGAFPLPPPLPPATGITGPER
jgi:hypothetical protein